VLRDDSSGHVAGGMSSGHGLFSRGLDRTGGGQTQRRPVGGHQGTRTLDSRLNPGTFPCNGHHPIIAPPASSSCTDSGSARGSSVTRVTVYALNLFDIADRDEYLAYSKRSPQEVAKHGGRVVALGQFRESVTGEIEPRKVLILVEWESKDAFDSYCNDPELADLHAHRENGSSSYIWHLFDRLDDLRPLLKPE
jgi:uncharacterized protein (DUF1330 family)